MGPTACVVVTAARHRVVMVVAPYNVAAPHVAVVSILAFRDGHSRGSH